MIIDLPEFLSLRQSLPVVDVRSEKEFAEGHIRGAVNIPLLNNEERVAVGTVYKQKGQKEAIKTGFRLVGPRIIDIINAAEALAGDRELLVHCWRGGMRSSNFCQFLGMARIKTYQLRGGYKAYRQEAARSFAEPFLFLRIGGCTGSGKTEVLQALASLGEQVIDLEKLACHKGSAFGGLMMPPQPTTEQFQNNLFETILGFDRRRRIWVEDESITIGKVHIPEPFWRQMCNSPVVELVVEKDVRIQRLVSEYGRADREDFLQAMERIVKKLGGQHFKAAKEKLMQGDMAATIEILLTYYDKTYHNGLLRKQQHIQFRMPWDGNDIHNLAHRLIAEVSSPVW